MTATNRLSPAQLERLACNGYLRLEDFLAPSWVDELEAIIAAQFAQECAEHEVTGQFYSVQRLSERAERLCPYFRAGRLPELARTILGGPVRLLSNRYVVKPAGCLEMFPWHRDCDEFANLPGDQGLTMWIPLVPVSVESGALWYSPGSHRPRDPATPEPRPIGLAMRRGDVALHSFSTMHMSGRNRTSAARPVVTLEFIRADALHPLTGRTFQHAVLLES